MRPETMAMLKGLVMAAVPDAEERKEALSALSRAGRDEWLTPGQAMRFAGVCRKTLFNWEKKGLLHPKKPTKGKTRFSKSELEAATGAMAAEF